MSSSYGSFGFFFRSMNESVTQSNILTKGKDAKELRRRCSRIWGGETGWQKAEF